jgi:hypothetical protein
MHTQLGGCLACARIAVRLLAGSQNMEAVFRLLEPPHQVVEVLRSVVHHLRPKDVDSVLVGLDAGRPEAGGDWAGGRRRARHAAW